MSMLSLVLLVVLILLLVGAYPMWPHAVAWGYYPSGLLVILIVVLLVLALSGKL